jgi:hypothetical protein
MHGGQGGVQGFIEDEGRLEGEDDEDDDEDLADNRNNVLT